MKPTTITLSAVALAAALGACALPGGNATAGSATATSGTITKVVDGDTVRVRPAAGGATIKVRVLGIDAPESSSLRYGRPDCGGAQAKSFARRQLPVGTAVTLRTDPTQDRRDRYGRLLAYVDLRGGGSMQLTMLRAGWAEVYVFDRPFRRLRSFRAAQAQARHAHRGVWKLCGGEFHRAA